MSTTSASTTHPDKGERTDQEPLYRYWVWAEQGGSDDWAKVRATSLMDALRVHLEVDDEPLTVGQPVEMLARDGDWTVEELTFQPHRVAAVTVARAGSTQRVTFKAQEVE